MRLSTIAFLALVGVAFASPKVVVPEDTYDFGTIQEGEEATHVFKILNQGDDSLVISKVRSS